MKYLVPVATFILATSLFGMNEAPFVMAKVFDEVTRDTREMELKHGEHTVLLNVDRNVAVSAEDIEEASAERGASGAWVIMLNFTEEGKEKLSRLTKESLNKRIAILIDDKLISAPVIRDTLTGGVAQVTGEFDQAFAEDFANRVNKGAIQSR